MIIDGKAVAADVRSRVAAEVEAFVAEHGVRPGLATILVGDDPASHVYVRNKRKASEEAGIASIHHELPAGASQDEVAELITSLNEDDAVSGILLQLPVPAQIDGESFGTTPVTIAPESRTLKLLMPNGSNAAL